MGSTASSPRTEAVHAAARGSSRARNAGRLAKPLESALPGLEASRSAVGMLVRLHGRTDRGMATEIPCKSHGNAPLCSLPKMGPW
jgi:hypothetical protein